MTHATGFSYSVWAYLDAGWVSLSALGDVVSGTLRGSDGMRTNEHTDRVSDIGQFEFDLKNFTGRYSPGHVNALPGWDNDIPVKILLNYDSYDYTIYGRIAPAPDGITIQAGEKGAPRVHVVVLDWMHQAATYPISNPGVLADKRGAEVLDAAIALMPIAPLAKILDTTVSLFSFVFDTVTSHTKSYDEIVKVALSEVGFAYIRPDRVNGETLILESATHRSGLDAETRFMMPSASAGKRLREDGGYKLREDGGYKTRDETVQLTNATSQLNITAFGITRGTNLLNRVSCYAYPRKLDTSPVVLFELSQPLVIAPGETITIRGTYANPAGGLPVNGQNMIAPVATTDYLFNSASDGSDTDLTANITIVSTMYGTEGFTHQVKNAGAALGYLTQYNTRGYGIYQYNPIEHTASNSTSINRRGVRSDALHQKYQQETFYGAVFVDGWVEMEKTPQTRINSITFCANYSPVAMNAFLNLGTGDLIRVSESQSAKDALCYIQGRDYQILPGGIIMVTWVLKEMLNLTLGLSLLGVQVNWPVPSQPAAISYGAVPWLQNMPQRTVVITFYPIDVTKTLQTLIEMGSIGTGGGEHFLSLDNGKIYYDVRYTTTNGEWHTTTTGISNGTWYRVAVAFDNTGIGPTIYVNGIKQTLVTDITPTGTVIPDVASPLSFGATRMSTGVFSQYFKGQLLNPLIYNRALSDSELASVTFDPLANPTITDGLVFQGFAVKTDDIGDYIGTLDDVDNRLTENIYGVIGIPSTAPNSPIGTSPMLTGRHNPDVANVSTKTGANVGNLTVAHTTSAGDNRALVVAIQKRAFDNVSTVTYGGVPLTLWNKNSFASGNYPQYEFWYLLAPPVGTANIVAIFPTNDYATMTAIGLQNVDQNVPFANVLFTTGTGSYTTLSNAAMSGTLIFDILAIEKGSATLTQAVGQTLISKLTSDGNWSSGTSTKPGAGITSTGWNVSSLPHNWVYTALVILGAK